MKINPRISNRPNWDVYMMTLALMASTRSLDAETQHGTVITDSQHRIISTGYNSFPAGMTDSQLPAFRDEDKYSYMIHSELNACLNMVSRDNKDLVAYVTGQSCNPCTYAMHQVGVRRLVMLGIPGIKATQLQTPQTEEIFRQFVKDTGLIIEYLPVSAILENIDNRCLPLKGR